MWIQTYKHHSKMVNYSINSIDTGTSQRSLQAKEMAIRISLRSFHPLSLSVIDFSPTAHAFFLRVDHPDGLKAKKGFLRIRTVPAVIVVFEEGRGISLIFKRGTRTFPYFEVPLFQWC
ncbi:hypothetical protein AVEN_141660-1 [Araneus ventricosus]|uniref:Uncharacterized protein n=1 Tax=Araneus ventricosus TaxID=182803 RepID=A0A4Y2IR15_ARAVE|nr:hypothetical protein AVEN_141660-1 [Araneus ventricosus]